jgi:hypothetical protein
MSLGASPGHSPTYQQKYPRPLNKVLKQLIAEIEETLDDRS